VPDVAGILRDAYFSTSNAAKVVDRGGRRVAVNWVNKLDSFCAIDIPRASEHCDAKYVAVACLGYWTLARPKLQRSSPPVTLFNLADNLRNAFRSWTRKLHTLKPCRFAVGLLSHVQSS